MGKKWSKLVKSYYLAIPRGKKTLVMKETTLCAVPPWFESGVKSLIIYLKPKLKKGISLLFRGISIETATGKILLKLPKIYWVFYGVIYIIFISKVEGN